MFLRDRYVLLGRWRFSLCNFLQIAIFVSSIFFTKWIFLSRWNWYSNNTKRDIFVLRKPHKPYFSIIYSLTLNTKHWYQLRFFTLANNLYLELFKKLWLGLMHFFAKVINLTWRKQLLATFFSVAQTIDY